MKTTAELVRRNGNTTHVEDARKLLKAEIVRHQGVCYALRHESSPSAGVVLLTFIEVAVEEMASELVGARGEDDPDSMCVVCGASYARVRRQPDWEALDKRMQVDLVGDGPGFVFPSPVCSDCWCPK